MLSFGFVGWATTRTAQMWPVHCNRARLLVEFVADANGDDTRQVNARIPDRSRGGDLTFTVSYGGHTSNSASISN